MFPALLVSVLLNLVMGGLILSTYLSPTNREDTQSSKFIPPVYQDHIEPDPKFGDKMDRLKDRQGDLREYMAEEQRFDNIYSQDMYYNLPRALYF